MSDLFKNLTPGQKLTLEELKEMTRSILHRLPKETADVLEVALNDGRYMEVMEIIGDHANNLRKQTS